MQKEYLINKQKGRRIRLLGPEQLDEYLPVYLNAYPAYKSIGDEGYAEKKERSLEIMEKDSGTHFVGLYENNRIIATMKLIDFDMNVFGKMQKAVGLMALAVDPVHKKSGAALDMVRFFEQYTKETGSAIALLLPFRIDFYKKMGYGFETRLFEYELLTEQLPKCEAGEQEKLVMLGKGDFEQVIGCYNRYVENNHGALRKFGEEARDMEEDSEVRRIGYMSAGELKGYVAFHFVSNHKENYTINLMEVDEIIYDSGAVLKALLGGLRLQSDLAQTVVLRTGEEDFYHILQNPQHASMHYIPFGYLQTNVAAIGVMHKLVDAEKFVKDTAYRRFPPYEMKVEFAYEEAITCEQKILRLNFDKCDNGTAGCWSLAEGEDFEPDVTVNCTESVFSSIIMGNGSVAALYRMGEIKVDREEYVGRLEYLFHCESHPFTNTDF